MGKLCFWMFVFKTDLYRYMGFFSLYIDTYVSEHTRDKAPSYLPHPTLPILNAYRFRRASQRCWLKQRAHKQQLGSIWQHPS